MASACVHEFPAAAAAAAAPPAAAAAAAAEPTPASTSNPPQAAGSLRRYGLSEIHGRAEHSEMPTDH